MADNAFHPFCNVCYSLLRGDAGALLTSCGHFHCSACARAQPGAEATCAVCQQRTATISLLGTLPDHIEEFVRGDPAAALARAAQIYQFQAVQRQAFAAHQRARLRDAERETARLQANQEETRQQLAACQEDNRRLKQREADLERQLLALSSPTPRAPPKGARPPPVVAEPPPATNVFAPTPSSAASASAAWNLGFGPPPGPPPPPALRPQTPLRRGDAWTGGRGALRSQPITQYRSPGAGTPELRWPAAELRSLSDASPSASASSSRRRHKRTKGSRRRSGVSS